MTATHEPWDAIVIGAGLAGWSAAHDLGQRGWRVLLLEAEDRTGGRVRTRQWQGLTYEQGALFAFDPAWVPFPVPAGERMTEIGRVGLFDAGRLITGATVADCLLAAGIEPRALWSLEPFLNRVSPRPATLGASAHAMLEAFFRVIHPGRLLEAVPERRRDALIRHEIAHCDAGNQALIDAFATHTLACARTGCPVTALHPEPDAIAVDWVAEGRPERARARRAILAVPAPEAHRLVAAAGGRGVATAFLAGIRQGAGIVVTLILRDAGAPPCAYVVCPDGPVNTFFFQRVMDEARTVVVTACLVGDQAAAQAATPDAALAALTHARLLELLAGDPADSGTDWRILVFSDVRRWPAVGPCITAAAYAGFSNASLCPLDRVVLAGDYTWWERSRMPYGMRAAIASGQRAAALACRDPAPVPLRHFRPGPLAVTEVIAMTEQGPRLRERIPDGTIAYHGLLLTAAPDDLERARYLVGECEDGLWSYQQGYGVTSLDSALVMEGLLAAGGHDALLRHAARRLVAVFRDAGDGGFWTIPVTRAPRAPYWSGTDSLATAHCAWLLWRIDPQAHARAIKAAALWLQRRQLVTGGWPGKWFPSETIPILYALRLLLALDDARFQSAGTRARDWLLGGQAPDGAWRGSVIETAAALWALSLRPEGQTAAIRHARDWLHRRRGPDGTWPGEPILHYWFEDQGRTTFFHTQDTGAVTTAWARLALAAAASTNME